MRVLAGVAFTLAACTSDSPPESSAQVIGKLEQTIGGPHAIGRVGDFLIQNDQVRFVVAGTGVCPRDPQGNKVDPTCVDTYGRVNITFGGTLVDADLQRIGPGSAMEQAGTNGNDQLAELLPGFAFSIINPTQISVTADGTDGKAAEVTVTGVTDNLFQMIGLLNEGLTGSPGSLDFTQVYHLEPGAKYLTIQTTIHNPSTGAYPFPYLQPSDLDSLTGFNIPGIGGLQLSVPLGQMPLFGGEQDLFAPGVSGFNVYFAIQNTYKMAGGFPAFPGMVVDYLATRGKGVSYGIATLDSPDNYVSSYPTGYPGQTVTQHSLLLPFTYAGVTAAYMFKPPDQLQAGEQRTYTSYFVVGRGDVASVYDTILELRGTSTGTFGGSVLDSVTSAPVANANVFVLDANGNPIDQIQTDAGGAFLCHLPVGNYTYIVDTDDRPVYKPKQGFTIAAGQQTGVLALMDPPAIVAVAVLDEVGRRAPVKIQLLGRNGQLAAGLDGRGILYSLQLGERMRPTSYDGTDEYVEGAWWTTDGLLETTVRPGTYTLAVSRGPEYEITTSTFTVGANDYHAEQLQLTRSYTSDGWVAGDFHIHAQPSTDSGLPIDQRVTSCAAEGLEVATATDHNYITDYSQIIAANGLVQWLLGISGMELTTFEMGHFIGYPLKVDPGSTRGGEFTWKDATPQQLFDQLRGLSIDPTNSVVTVAHPRQQVLGYFSQFFVDQDTAQPYTPTGILGVFAPYGDNFQAQNFSYDFDAMEVITGRRFEDIHVFSQNGAPVLGKDGRPTYPGTVETWFTLLDHGRMPTGMGASDSHHLLGDEPGYARTLIYVGSGNDTPGGYTRDEVIAGIRGHHTIATNAPFVTITVAGGMIGDTVKASGAIPVTIDVSAPSWAAVDTLTLYGSSGTSTTPDHVIQTMPIPAPGTTFHTVITINPTQDAWVVAEVTGATNMFPVLSPTEFPPLDVSAIIGGLAAGIDLSSLPITPSSQPNHLHVSTPYAITNPIWIDVDGGGWTPPLAPLAKRAAPPGPPPDVRDVFEALPEVSR
ncbi:MAG TPA: CehA/McbA family metallohydrolase [Kofleriaceae bacterium]|nr:CehA/McbA family metallohydrolase [Kofleriaceae bacterium]